MSRSALKSDASIQNLSKSVNYHQYVFGKMENIPQRNENLRSFNSTSKATQSNTQNYNNTQTYSNYNENHLPKI
jgi:hypothetical protein